MSGTAVAEQNEQLIQNQQQGYGRAGCCGPDGRNHQHCDHGFKRAQVIAKSPLRRERKGEGQAAHRQTQPEWLYRRSGRSGGRFLLKAVRAFRGDMLGCRGLAGQTQWLGAQPLGPFLWRDLQRLMVGKQACRLHASGYAQVTQRGCDVLVNPTRRDAQTLGDLFGLIALRHQAQAIALSRCEALYPVAQLCLRFASAH